MAEVENAYKISGRNRKIKGNVPGLDRDNIKMACKIYDDAYGSG